MKDIRYVVITPVRDEAALVGQTVESMLSQTHPPVRWIIVDDGSTDGTRDVILERIQGIDWVRLLDTESARRDLGTGEVLAFNCGLASLCGESFDFLVKLDADVRFGRDYFEQLLTRMSADPRWGIASGVYWEQKGPDWRPIQMPPYHAAGASKVVRRTCYEQIGGFVAAKGWDTLDEIRARMRGWKTGHFTDIRFDHLKPEGMAMGSLSTHRFHGEIYYQTGGGLLFLVPKAVHRALLGHPPIASGLALLQGYAAAATKRKERLVTPEEQRFYQRMLRQRLTQSITQRLQLWFRQS